MAIVKKLVDFMKGTVDFESKEGKGTAVTVSIPTELTAPQQHVAEKEPSGDERALQDLKILLVDDDRTVLKFTELLLKSLGAQVTSYLGGIRLRDNFQKLDYDLAMLDLQMPEVNGYDALKIIRGMEQYKDLPIFALTANVYAEEKESIKAEGFDGLILKPFKEKELVSQILQYIDVSETKAEERPDPETRVQPGKSYDLSAVEKYCMGDAEMLKELVVDFCNQTHQDLTDLNKALENKNYARLQDIAHQLASRFAQFNIPTSSKAKKLEDQLKTSKKEGIQNLVKEITQEAYGVLEEMTADFDYMMEF
jgi:CheY-like chemotaxis protein